MSLFVVGFDGKPCFLAKAFTQVLLECWDLAGSIASLVLRSATCKTSELVKPLLTLPSTEDATEPA